MSPFGRAEQRDRLLIDALDLERGRLQLWRVVVEANHHEVVIVAQRQPRTFIARRRSTDEELYAPIREDKVGVRDVPRGGVVARTLGVHLHADVDRVADAAAQSVSMSG